MTNIKVWFLYNSKQEYIRTTPYELTARNWITDIAGNFIIEVPVPIAEQILCKVSENELLLKVKILT